jgi:transposase
MKKSSALFIGLDDSKDLIQVGVAEGDRSGEIRDWGGIPNRPEAVIKLVRRLGRPKDLFFVYEAGPCGYGLYRQLTSLGASCMVAAPSKTPRRAGDRIKNDRRDALTLARLHRAGELSPVWVPDVESEAMRDLTRAREDAKYAQTRARQRLNGFLLRHGRHYPGRSRWTQLHSKWIATQRSRLHHQDRQWARPPVSSGSCLGL